MSESWHEYERRKYGEACGWDELQAETDRWMRARMRKRKLKPSKDPRVDEALRVARMSGPEIEAVSWALLCNWSRRKEDA